MDESSVYRSVPQTLPRVPLAGKKYVKRCPFMPRSELAEVCQSPNVLFAFPPAAPVTKTKLPPKEPKPELVTPFRALPA